MLALLSPVPHKPSEQFFMLYGPAVPIDPLKMLREAGPLAAMLLGQLEQDRFQTCNVTDRVGDMRKLRHASQ